MTIEGDDFPFRDASLLLRRRVVGHCHRGIEELVGDPFGSRSPGVAPLLTVVERAFGACAESHNPVVRRPACSITDLAAFDEWLAEELESLDELRGRTPPEGTVIDAAHYAANAFSRLINLQPLDVGNVVAAHSMAYWCVRVCGFHAAIPLLGVEENDVRYGRFLMFETAVDDVLGGRGEALLIAAIEDQIKSWYRTNPERYGQRRRP